MAAVDEDVLVEAQKALGIIFILATSITSLVLLATIFRRLQSYNLRSLMLFIMSCGTLLYSLFYLVVLTILLFEPQNVTCRSVVHSTTYGGSYFPFVYALALQALTLELYMAKKGYTFLQSAPAKIIFIAGPWIIGCIIVLPLTLSGMNWTFCNRSFTLSRVRAIIWICNLLPALALLIPFIVVHKLRVLSTQNHSPPMPTYSHPQSNLSSPPTFGQAYPQAGYNQGSGIVIAPPPLGPQQYNPEASHLNQTPNSYSVQPPPYEVSQQYEASQQYNPDVRNKQQEYVTSTPQNPNPVHHTVPQYQHPQQQQQQVMTTGNTIQSPVVTQVPETPRDFNNEAKALLSVIFFFGCCSIPRAIQILAYDLNTNRIAMSHMSYTVMSQFFFWLSILQWPLINVSWVKSAHL